MDSAIRTASRHSSGKKKNPKVAKNNTNEILLVPQKNFGIITIEFKDILYNAAYLSIVQ
jgi:hypothetical protein